MPQLRVLGFFAVPPRPRLSAVRDKVDFHSSPPSAPSSARTSVLEAAAPCHAVGSVSGRGVEFRELDSEDGDVGGVGLIDGNSIGVILGADLAVGNRLLVV